MRLFVAIPLPEEVKQRLEELQQPMRGVRWQRLKQYHITLRFIGEVDQGTMRTIQEGLGRIHITSFELEINGMGCFPKGKYPRVLWAGLEHTPSLMQLQERVEQVCRDAGLEPENRAYKPHITLAKIKGASGRAVMSFINRNKQFKISEIPAPEFVLYSSTLHADGAVHTPVERYLLV